MKDIVPKAKPKLIDAVKIRQALWRLQSAKEPAGEGQVKFFLGKRAGINLGIRELKQLLGDC